MPPKDRDSGLSGEERALWQEVTKGAAPLKKKPPAPEPASLKGSKARQAPAKPAKIKLSRPTPAPKAVPRHPAPSLGHGDIADVDKRSAERMRRGRMAIQGTLDLHGFTQDQARRELSEYLARAQDAGKRCILVVTGKGDMMQGGGVLRAQVPRWLNEADTRPRVLAFDYAQPKHGGLGAIYVLLRKRRP